MADPSKMLSTFIYKCEWQPHYHGVRKEQGLPISVDPLLNWQMAKTTTKETKTTKESTKPHIGAS